MKNIIDLRKNYTSNQICNMCGIRSEEYRISVELDIIKLQFEFTNKIILFKKCKREIIVYVFKGYINNTFNLKKKYYFDYNDSYFFDIIDFSSARKVKKFDNFNNVSYDTLEKDVYKLLQKGYRNLAYINLKERNQYNEE